MPFATFGCKGTVFFSYMQENGRESEKFLRFVIETACNPDKHGSPDNTFS